MTIEKLIKDGEELSDWIGSQLDGLELQSDKKTVLACACFHISLEHHRSIVLLISRGLNGSALTLVRPTYESLVRGLWIQHSATDKQIIEYEADRLSLEFWQLLRAVEAVPGWDHGLLSEVKKRFWGAMNSYTHTGILQTSRRFNGSEVQSCYDSEDLLKTLSFTGAVSLLTGVAVAGLANNVPLAASFLEKAKEFSGISK